jgi:hypothetical protein
MPDRPSARRRREDDEDDRPRRPRARREDDEDRPKSRRREDDDRPASRRRRDDGDRPRKKRAARRFSPLVLFVVLPVGGLLVAGIIGLVVWAFVADRGKGPSNDLLAWAPADTSSVTYLEYGYLRGIPQVNNSAVARLDEIRLYGLDPAEVATLLRAEGPGGPVVALKATGPIDRDRVLQKLSGTARTLTEGGKTYHEVPGHGYAYFPSPDVMVVARNQKALTDRLGKTEGKVVAPDDVQKVLGRLSGHAYTVSINRGGVMTHNGERLRAKASSVRIVNGQVDHSGELEFEDGPAAQRAYDHAQTVATQQPALLMKVNKSGLRLTVTRAGPLDKESGTLTEFLFNLR